MQTVFKFTKPSLDALPLAVNIKDQYRVWDTELSGFGLTVNKGGKKYIVQHKTDRKTHFKTFGQYAPRQEMSIDDARKRAREYVVQWDKGLDDDAAAAVQAVDVAATCDDKVTLKQAMEIYLARCEKKGRSAVTIRNYRYDIETYFADWLERPLASIKRRECVALHDALTAAIVNGKGRGKRKVKGGKATADKAFRGFRAVYNYYREKVADDGFPANPADAVESNHVEACREVVSRERLPKWWKETANKNPIRRDAWRLILLTGLRSNAATSLRFDEIDFDNGTITRARGVEGMKNKRNFTVPVSRYVLDLLKRRQADNARDLGDNDRGWVFPTRAKKDAKDCRGQIVRAGEVTHIRDIHDKGFEGTHILRHTLLSMSDDYKLRIPKLHEKLLANHGELPKSLGDITEDYKGVRGLESLRHSAELITKTILTEVGESYEMPAAEMPGQTKQEQPATATPDDPQALLKQIADLQTKLAASLTKQKGAA